MGLRSALARVAVSRAHVLVLAGADALPLLDAFEASLRRRAWVLASSPAEADVLVVLGTADAALSRAAHAIYEQLPSPRTRIAIDSAAGVDDALDQARAALLDDENQRRIAADRKSWQPGAAESMDSPAGIDLAGGAEDRDGLEMDQLHVRLGAGLPAWPFGLTMNCVLRGDVVVEVTEVEMPAPPDTGPDADPAARRAVLLNAAADVLTLAGARHEARVARGLRARAAVMSPEDILRAREAVARSRVLRWSLVGVGHRPGKADPDVRDLLLRLYDDAVAPALGGDSITGGELAGRVEGLDLAALRLVVAALGPRVSGVASAVAEPGAERRG